MEVAHTSMIHAASPNFLWPFAVRYAAHQLNLWPYVSLPETSPTLHWTGKVGDASVFQVWGSRAFVRVTSADKLSASAIPCVFLGFVPDAPGWQLYHPASRRVLPSQDVTFDESVPFYHLSPYRSAPSPPPPLFLAPGLPPVDPLPPQGPAPSGVSQVDPLPVQVAVVSGAAPGAASGGAASGGAGSEGAGSGGAEPVGVEPGGAESEGAESGGAEPRGAASSGASEPGGAGAGGAVVTTGVGDPTEPGAAGAGGAGARVAGVGGLGAGGAGAAGAGDVDPGAGGTGGTLRPRPYFVPLLEQVVGVPSSPGLPPPFLSPPPDQSQPPLQPASPLPVPSPYTEQSGGLTERREPVSRPVSPVRTACRAPRSRPPPVPATHTMALCPSSVPLRVPLPAPPESSLPEVPDPDSDRTRAASPTVARLLATAVTGPSFESAAASALVAELLNFAVACRLGYASALVAESVPASPPSVGGECALGTDVLEDRQEDFECLAAAVLRFAFLLLAPEGDPDAPDIPTPRSYAEAITGPYSSQWQAAMDAEMASWKSRGTYVDEVPPPGVNIVDGMWIFRGVDYFHTFSPTPKMTSLRVLLHVAAQCDYELHSLDFSTAFLQGSLHEEIWLRRPPGFTGSFPTGTEWSLRRPVYGLRQAPRKWHDTLRTTLAALGFVPSTADPSLFLRTDTSLPPFYVLAYLGLQITRDRARCTITLTRSHMVHQVLQRFGFQYSSPQLTPLSTSHSLSAPPSDESVEPSGPYPELAGCLMYLMTGTRPDLAYPLSFLARYVAPGRHRKVHWDAAKRVLRYLCSTSGMGLVLGGQGPVVLTGHVDASWVDDSATQRSSQGYTFSLGSGSELRWLTYLLTDLGEQPRSPPVLYVDNKAMIALCHGHRLEHRTKHMALRYFLARELQQRGQLRLAPTAAIVTVVDPVANAGVAETLEARLADARTRHADGEYGTIPLLIVELGIRSQWAKEHPSRPFSPRPVRNEGGIDDEVDGEVDGGARVSGNNGTKQRGVIKVDGGVDRSQARVQQSTAAAGSSRADVDGRRRSPLRSGGGLSATTHVTVGGIAPTYGYFKFSPDRITVAPLQRRRDLITWRESIEPQLEVAGLKGFADGTVPIPSVDDVGLRGEFRAAHLLTFMVISRCCSPVVQLALRSCRERLDAGHQLWHFILSTYQVRDDLYIAQLEEKMTHIRMGEQESATDYCNRARRILAEMRMAGAEYSTASYISHIVKGLPRGYNLMKRMMMVPGTRESLDEDSITSHILQDKAMQEAEQPTELLPQANYAASAKLNQQQGQRRMPGRGGSRSGRSTKDVDEKRSTRDKGRGGGGRRRECWICHDPEHLSYECPDRDDSDEDDTKGGLVISTSCRPRQDARPRKEKQTSRKTSSTKDVDNSSGKSRGDGEASCSMVGVVELSVSLAPEAGEDFQAVVAAVQANLMAVLLDSGCSHHLMGTKAVFVDMAPSDGMKHVRRFNRALQPVDGRGTVALQGEAGKRVLISDVLYVPGIQAKLLSAGQLKESGVQLHGDGDEMLLVAAAREVLSRSRYNGRVLCADLHPYSTWWQTTEVVALRTIVSETNSTPDRLHARLAHVSVNMIKSSAKHAVATGLDITSSTRADPPCVSCVGGKLARHTFPNKGSDAEEALAVMHIDLCGPFRVAAKDGSLYFLLLKDRHTRFVWVMPVAKKSDVLWEIHKWLVLVERQAKKLVLMLCSDRGGEFLGKEFIDFVDGKGIVHDLTCPYTPQQNGMAEREMRTVVESVRTMLLHMGVQHH
ncbi:unnamed protein product [Closterium sp. NIES-54]